MYKKPIIGLLALLLVFGIGAVVGLKVIRTHTADTFNEKAVIADRQYNEGNFDQFVQMYEQLISENKDTLRTPTLQSQLAAGLYYRNNGDDQKRAADIFKQIATNETYSSLVRASAVNDLLDLYNKSYDEKFAREVVFQGAPLERLLTEDMYKSVTEAYRYSFSVYPFPISAFRIAQWYGFTLDQKGTSLSDVEKTEFRVQLKQWMEKGEELLAKEVERKVYKRSKLASIYMFDGVTQGLVGDSLRENPNLAAVHYRSAEDLFKTALAMLSPEDETNSYSVGLFTRFYYAAMLSEVYGDKRSDDVKILLAPILRTPEKFGGKRDGLDNFLKNRKRSCAREFAAITKVVPEFGRMLVDRGINCSQ